MIITIASRISCFKISHSFFIDMLAICFVKCWVATVARVLNVTPHIRFVRVFLMPKASRFCARKIVKDNVITVAFPNHMENRGEKTLRKKRKLERDWKMRAQWTLTKFEVCLEAICCEGTCSWVCRNGSKNTQMIERIEPSSDGHHKPPDA